MRQRHTMIFFLYNIANITTLKSWSKAYNDLLPMYVVRSMSRAGTPTDNSAMESINGWIKAELFMDFHVTGERPVYEEVNEYIKFFNEERPAYALSYLTPKQYRERYAA